MTFTKLAGYIKEIEQTTSRIAITEHLAALFKEAKADEIQQLCYLLQGRVAPLFEPREFGIADKFVIRALAQAFSVEQENVVQEYKKNGDLGITAQQFSTKSSSQLSVTDVFAVLFELTDITGDGSQEKKITALSSLFSKLDSLSLRYVTRIPLGKMRLGFSDMTLLDAISWMITGDKTHKNVLEEAFHVRPDIGYIAKIVKEQGIEHVSHIKMIVGAPIIPCLCQRLPTATEMVEKMGMVSIEPKYDGVRVQIHVKRDKNNKHTLEVNTYSRNLERTTEMFPELLQIEKFIKADSVILDAEAVGIDPKTGSILPFQETTTRKRKHNIDEAVATVPLRFYLFDMLYLNNQELLNVPLSERRRLLEDTITENTLLVIAPHIVTDNPSLIRKYHEEQRKKGLEGIVVKQWSGGYEPGRRGYNWVKLKQEEGASGKLSDTIDAVVMGYYLGEGKRSEFGIGAFLVGIRDKDSFLTVSKIGTGVSDEQWRQLKDMFEKEKTQIQPSQYKSVDTLLSPDVWIHPRVVVEIAGDDLTKSPNHGAGIAIRFPRLVKVRKDKSADQATTLDEIKDLFKHQ